MQFDNLVERNSCENLVFFLLFGWAIDPILFVQNMELDEPRFQLSESHVLLKVWAAQKLGVELVAQRALDFGS